MHSFKAIITVTAALTLFPFPSASAAMIGQPATSAEVVEKMRAEAQNILKGEIATGRPNLFLLVQDNASADFTELLARVVGDDTTYTGVTETLDEASENEKDTKRRQFILYNLARVHLLRSRFLTLAKSRRSPLGAAENAADHFDPDLRDPAAWELKGDIDAENENLDGALAAYRKMEVSGAPRAEVEYKDGWACERANRIGQAETAYRSALTAQKTNGDGGPQLRHRIYQGLARTALAQGNDAAALSALAQSARVGQDDAAPFHYELVAAARLLQRGYATAVRAYADAALRAFPDDADARELRDRAARTPGAR